MDSKPVIGTTTLGEIQHTLGLDIVSEELSRAGYKTVQVDAHTARTVDILLVSLYWADQIIAYPKWLISARINPAERKPIIILGGSMLYNPWPLKGMFHYAVIGDGESVALQLIRDIEAGNESGIPCVVYGQDFERGVTAHAAPELPMNHYVQKGKSNITRIEIARGCKKKCRFCQLTHIKPYREVPAVVLKNLIATSPTKSIGLFSPDRASYSSFEQLEEWCRKYGKNNVGSDLRLDVIRNMSVATTARFGIDGFSERERKWLGKPYKADRVVDDLAHLVNDVQTPKGRPTTTMTNYMILGCPKQTTDDYLQFVDVLRRFDDRCGHKVTMFLSFSDFMPSNHTPLERESKDIWTDHMASWLKVQPFLENVVIARRGGSRGPSMRLAQLLVFRGGQNAHKALFRLSNGKGFSGLLKNRSRRAGEKILQMYRDVGVDTVPLVEGYENGQPWDFIKTAARSN